MTYDILFAVAFSLALILSFFVGFAVAHIQVNIARQKLFNRGMETVANIFKQVEGVKSHDG